MAAYEILLLNTAIPQIQAAQSGDTYVVPRDIAFSTVASLAAGTEALPSLVATGDTNTGFWFPAADTIAASTGGTRRLTLDSSGNLGLGVTPSAGNGKLQVQGANATTSIGGVATATLYDGDANNEYAILSFSTNAGGTIARVAAKATTTGAYPSSVGQLEFGVQNGGGMTTVATMDATGNLGLGVTPSAWGNGVSMQGSGWSLSTLLGFDQSALYTNARQTAYGGFNTNWVYRGTASATGYAQSTGSHVWLTAPSGTAGNAISFTQAMTLDASGNLLVAATSAPSSSYFGGGNAVTRLVTTTQSTANSYNNLMIDGGSNGGSSVGFTRSLGTLGALVGYNYAGGSGDGLNISVSDQLPIRFSTNSGSGATERARITSGGNLEIANGNLVMSTSGKGIDFSATAGPTNGTMTSELLADYEEGTWTPNYAGSTGSAGTYAASSQSGWYTKVGNMVTAWYRLILSNKGSWTGDALITGLPFTVANPAGTFDGANAIGVGNVTFSGYVYTEPNRGATTVSVINAVSATGLALLQTTAVNNDSALLGQVTYFV